MDAFITRRGGAGGGLNFKVVGGTTKPSSPKENTIWVNTDQEITGWSFSAEADKPETPDEGMLWFKTTDASYAKFNALKENALFVYPIMTAQYVSGSWIERDIEIYQNGEWYTLSGIPSAYQKVEYLQSSGTQYIDVGCDQNINTGFEIVYSYPTAEAWAWVFGVQTTSGKGLFGIRYSSNHQFFLASDPQLYSGSLGKEKVTAEFNSGNLFVNSVNRLSGVSMSNLAGDRNIILFGVRLSSNDQLGTSRIYSFKLFENDELIRDFIPCYRKKDSVAGMYDTVTKTFFTNMGTGTFMVGGDVA